MTRLVVLFYYVKRLQERDGRGNGGISKDYYVDTDSGHED